MFATLLIRQNVCNIGFCNILFLAKKFAILCFATCQKNAKFHATFFCNKNVAKIRFCNICVDFGNVLKNKVISSGVKIATKDGTPSQSKLFYADSTCCPLIMQINSPSSLLNTTRPKLNRAISTKTLLPKAGS